MRAAVILVAASCLLPAAAFATATQDEVLKSINQSVGHEVDGGRLLAAFLAIAALLVLLAFLGQRQKRAVTPKTLNHPGKLLKEVSRSVQIRPAELKQLRILSEGYDTVSPLLLVLCPSLLAKAAREKSDRVDRDALASLAKKMAEK